MIDKVYFDWKYYKLNNKDLLKLNANELFDHWINYGLKEKRKFRDNRLTLNFSKFNWKVYITFSKDLLLFKNPNKANEHWYLNGQYEGRICEISKEYFDWKKYLIENKIFNKNKNDYDNSKYAWENINSIINTIHQIKKFIKFYDNRKVLKYKKFNWKYYISLNKNLNIQKKEEAIDHWYTYGQYDIIKYNYIYVK